MISLAAVGVSSIGAAVLTQNRLAAHNRQERLRERRWEATDDLLRRAIAVFGYEGADG